MKVYHHLFITFLFCLFYGTTTKCDAQVYDNFSDGNFTANPIWLGDQAFFQVVDEQLNSNGPHSNGNSARDTIALYTNNSSIDSTEWQFLIDLKFNPTNDNVVRIYLVSDAANLRGQLNGYYVELGRTSADSIKFFRQNGWNKTLLFTGTSSFASNILVRIKVTRGSSGQWQIFADPTGGTNFQPEGAAFIDNSITATSYFGIYCRYMTDSRYNLYFFDDFYVGPWLIDTVAPQVVSVTPITVYEVDILFDEPLDPTTVQTLSYYVVNNSIGNPQSAIVDGSNPALIHLTFDGTFEDGLQYAITIQGVKDISGNAMAQFIGYFTYYYPVIPAFRDIVINEIMADPSPVVQLPELEFVEIFNKSNKNINLQGWMLSDGASSGTFPMIILSPDEYAIVCPITDTALFSSFGKVIGLSAFPSLNNSGDNVILKSNLNVTIDSLTYDISWYADADKDDGGYTLEQINPYKNDNCPAYINWKASNSATGGSPGSQNSVFSIVPDTIAPQITSISFLDSLSIRVEFNEPVDISTINSTSNYAINNNSVFPVQCIANNELNSVKLIFNQPFLLGNQYQISVYNMQDCAGNIMPNYYSNIIYYYPIWRDIVINEIMADPSPVVQLPELEFVEIFNKSNKNINLQGWMLSDGASSGTFPMIILSPDEYAIVCPITDTALFSSFGKVIGLSAFPSLNNSGDNVILKSNLNVTIDSLTYDISWYADADKDDGGYTLEQINPYKNDNCPAYINWKASNSATGGTPGSQNSVFSIVPDTIAPQITSISFLDSVNIQVNYSEPIDIGEITTISNYAINNNTVYPVQCLANNELNSVKLEFAQPFIFGSLYQILVYNISDCSGNAMANYQDSIVYYIPAWGDIVINEIMADPTPPLGLPEAEFIELYNKSNFPINLKNWKLSTSATSTTFYNIPDFTVPAKGFALLCSYDDTLLFGSVANVVSMSSFPTLNNTGSFLALRNENTAFIDSLSYQISWYKDPNKDDGGYSLELINPFKDSGCPPFSNWMAANNTNGGTPGIVNSVFSLSPDTLVPSVLSVIIQDSVSVKVVFSESMNVGITDKNNYQLSLGDSVIEQISTNSNYNSALISLKAPLQEKIFYQIQFLNLYDCSGNLMPAFTDSIARYNPQIYDVVINEIMADPNPPVLLPAFEYVELYNNSNYPVNLTGWQFDYGSSSKTMPECAIKPHSFILLTKTDAVAPFLQYGQVLGLFSDVYALTDDGLPLVLKNPKGEIIHFVQYDKNWYGDNNKTEGGWALEQIDPSNPCGEKNNWKASVDKNGGTPCTINSVYAKNTDNTVPIINRIAYIDDSTFILHFSEIMHQDNITNPQNFNISNDIGQPKAVVLNFPDKKSVTLSFFNPVQHKIIYTLTITDTIYDCIGNKLAINSSARFAIPEAPVKDKVLINEILSKPKDEGVDFVEIINISDDVYDFKDLLIGNFDIVSIQAENIKAISEQSFLMFPKEYYVITTNPDIIQHQYTCGSALNFVKVAGMPTFSNDEGTVAITNKQLEIVDKLAYNSDMHFALLNSTYGVSLERLSIYRASNDLGNWHSAAQQAGFATPALQNSQYTDVASITGELSLLPEIFSPDNDGYQDVLTLIYKAVEPGYTISVKIYDQSGKPIAKIADNYLSGVGENYFTWNGLKDNNEKAPIGIYIVFAEVFNLKGEVKQYKKVVTLAGMFK